MKTLPTNQQEWMSLLTIPFKTFVLSFGFIYFLYWSPYPFPQFTPWAIGYFVAFLALVGTAVVQTVTGNFRDAVWSGLFGLLALCIVLCFIFYPKVR